MHTGSRCRSTLVAAYGRLVEGRLCASAFVKQQSSLRAALSCSHDRYYGWTCCVCLHRAPQQHSCLHHAHEWMNAPPGTIYEMYIWSFSCFCVWYRTVFDSRCRRFLGAPRHDLGIFAILVCVFLPNGYCIDWIFRLYMYCMNVFSIVWCMFVYTWLIFVVCIRSTCIIIFYVLRRFL